MTRAIATSDKPSDEARAAQPSEPGASHEMRSDAHIADEAWDALLKLFSSPSVARHAHLSCCTDGPNEFDILFESISDEQFWPNPNSKYKRWLRHLRCLGFIPEYYGTNTIPVFDCTTIEAVREL